MQARQINPYECAGDIVQAVTRGVLLTTKAEGKVNTMVIGWGQLGMLWVKPTFTAFVRTSRASSRMLDINPQFTVNIPVDGGLPKDVFALAGTASGRDHDKIAELGLTLVDAHKIEVPAIAEVPLTLECKVVYRHEMDQSTFPAEAIERFYPSDVTDINSPGSCYTHVAYVGEIVDAYVLED